MTDLRIKYRGSAAHAGMLADELRAAGLEVEYEPPLERGDDVPDAIDVVYIVVGAATSGVIGDYSAAAVRVIVDQIRERMSGVEIELDDE